LGSFKDHIYQNNSPTDNKLWAKIRVIIGNTSLLQQFSFLLLLAKLWKLKVFIYISFHKFYFKTLQCCTVIIHENVKGKGKAIPLQAWTGPEGSRRLRLPDFKTLGTRRW